jgi:hypothetical protein
MLYRSVQRTGYPDSLTEESYYFQGGSVDYGPKSICSSQWNSFGDSQVGSMMSPT